VAKRTVTDADANRPNVAFDVFEAQAGMARIVLEVFKRLAGSCLNYRGQLPEGVPERW